MTHTNQQPDTILRRPAVEQMVGLSRSGIYALISRGEFPKPIRLTSRAVGWRLRDIQGWLEARAQSAL